MKRAILIAVLSIAASVFAMPTAAESTFADIFDHYEAIRQVLIEDATDGVAGHATAIADATAALARDFDATAAQIGTDDADAVRGWLPEIEARARAVASADGLEPTREAVAELTRPLVRWHELVEGGKPVVAYCPMVEKAWLQPDEAIGNPYAPYMLRCGEVVQR
jgi:Cu(I)/Ag(I) efflux system membrane fusion protein